MPKWKNTPVCKCAHFVAKGMEIYTGGEIRTNRKAAVVKEKQAKHK